MCVCVCVCVCVCFINVCIYLLKLIHINQAYSILSTER